MTARPAPLTMSAEQERAILATASEGKPLLGTALGGSWPVTVAAIYRELDATRAQLAAVTLRLDRLAEAVYRALADWSDGPPTMKETADWANRNAPMLALARADALSPTQPTPTEGNES